MRAHPRFQATTPTSTLPSTAVAWTGRRRSLAIICSFAAKQAFLHKQTVGLVDKLLQLQSLMVNLLCSSLHRTSSRAVHPMHVLLQLAPILCTCPAATENLLLHLGSGNANHNRPPPTVGQRGCPSRLRWLEMLRSPARHPLRSPLAGCNRWGRRCARLPGSCRCSHPCLCSPLRLMYRTLHSGPRGLAPTISGSPRLGT
mmetsp:Transcript_49285/g.107535  ORF Transcript_49285/g.107535 Transcript_49285/m.107535 type:complete len:200 (+) Transcript_49285:258-857(+)